MKANLVLPWFNLQLSTAKTFICCKLTMSLQMCPWFINHCLVFTASVWCVLAFLWHHLTSQANLVTFCSIDLPDPLECADIWYLQLLLNPFYNRKHSDSVYYYSHTASLILLPNLTTNIEVDRKIHFKIIFWSKLVVWLIYGYGIVLCWNYSVMTKRSWKGVNNFTPVEKYQESETQPKSKAGKERFLFTQV